jgi:hypothetical protein
VPAKTDAPVDAFSLLISRADRARLLALVRENLSRFTERDALQVLRHPFLSAPVIEEILLAPKLLRARAVRKLVALSPLTPRPAAVESLEYLLWRELVDVGRNTRTPMPVRTAANRRILESMPRLSVGEKVALARLADRPLFGVLLETKEVRVFAALLQNPRLTEDDLVAWITVGDSWTEALGALCAEPRWSCLPQVRGALLANPRTPRAAAIALLATGTRAEWRRIMDDPTSDRLLSACAKTLYDERHSPFDRSARDRVSY